MEEKLTQREIEIIGTLGGGNLHEMTRKFSEPQLKSLEERFLLKRELAFWELGFRKKWLLFAFCSIFGIIGYRFSENLKTFFEKLNFGFEFWSPIICFFAALITFSLADIGRICLFFKSRKDPEEIDKNITKIAQMMLEEEERKKLKKLKTKRQESKEEEEEKKGEKITENIIVEIAKPSASHVFMIEGKNETNETKTGCEQKNLADILKLILANLEEGGRENVLTTDEIKNILKIENVASRTIGKALSLANFRNTRIGTKRAWFAKKKYKI